VRLRGRDGRRLSRRARRVSRHASACSSWRNGCRPPIVVGCAPA
jgi:hypothetical protein